MENYEIKEKREIKRLSKEFKGMKERFKTSNLKNFKIVTSMFLTNVYRAYQINDINLNEVVRKNYRVIHDLLLQRIYDDSEKLRDEIFEFLFIVEPVMENFILQAGKLYE